MVNRTGRNGKGEFNEGNQVAAGRINRRMTRGEMLPYRTRYISGKANVDELAAELMAEFSIDTLQHAKEIILRRKYGENWDFLRERHAEIVAERIMDKEIENEVERFSKKVGRVANLLLDAGAEALMRLDPANITEAVMMIKEGRDAGYRALGEPAVLTRQDVNFGGTLSVEHSAVHELQGLDRDQFALIAKASLAELAATLDGPAVTEGHFESRTVEGPD